jgi:hypothetical protein
MRHFFATFLAFSLLIAPAVCAETLSLQFLPEKDVTGQPLPSFKDTVVAILLANRDKANDAQRIGEELAFAYRGQRRFAVVSVVDVSSAPSFMQDNIRQLVLEKIRVSEIALRERFKSAKEPYDPPPGSVVVDWSGEMTKTVLAASERPEYALLNKSPRGLSQDGRLLLLRKQQELRNHAQLFVINPNNHSARQFVDLSELSLMKTYLNQLLGKQIADSMGR